ncbi:MAG: hypothetical protein CVU11_13925 [Bacteroidetes bacterium HGW-Bacteroidetes-6]|jgi:hypothetical protein|nr:MAG: hypothetical protein CVU11_13925 [Bacteroidetes bacterium HGW-Bacteroidetes-6]
MKKLLTIAMGLLLAGSLSAQHSIANPFFDQVTYRGAFDATTDWTAGWANWDAENTTYGATTVTKSGEITANETWTSGNVYKIEGFLYVRDGATLTIEAGTVIRGDKNTKGTLIIERGAKLNAMGTSGNPIVFTSNEAAGSRDYGDWGGIILCGKAAINVPGGEAQIEGGPTSYYGGAASPNDADNSGILQYVRIEFPGIPFVTDKEINGLTLGGVGSGTTIDHIQVYRSGDDSYEWFGGTVNAKYLVAAFGWDDDFDTDYGFRGMVQYAVSLRDSSIADPGSGSNGFESDNDGTGSTNSPQTMPIFSNVSMFGPKVTAATNVNTNYKRAMHLRRNSAINIYNSFFAGYIDGLYIDGTLSRENLINGEMKLYGITMAGVTGNYFVQDTLNIIRDWYNVAYRNNDTLLTNTELMITDPFNYGNPDFRPMAGSPVLADAIFSGVEELQVMVSGNVALYPNPASDVVNIEYELNNIGQVNIQILDMQGRLITTVFDGNQQAGIQTVQADVNRFESGMYFVRITTENNSNVVRFFR